MEKITYKITTVSSLIVSPRSNLAFYEVLEEFSLENVKAVKDENKFLNKDKLNIIYPFYQYGIYNEYNPSNAEYYLPGSSIKGALCKKPLVAGSIMVDDVKVSNEHIVLRNLYKAQYLINDKPQSACYNVFFENVGVEMIKANVDLEGELILDGIKAANELLAAANKSTQIKIEQMNKYLCELKNREYPFELIEQLELTIEKLSPLLKERNIFLIGGYKGVLHSMEMKDTQQEIAGAVFLDPETALPHGLVKIELL